MEYYCVECLRLLRKHPNRTRDEMGLYSREMYICNGTSFCRDHVPAERCKHGVWSADKCYECENLSQPRCLECTGRFHLPHCSMFRKE